MLKTISAALLAASVIAAPALAAEVGKTAIDKTAVDKTVVNKTDAAKTTQAPVIKADQAQSKVSTTAAKPEAKSDTKASAKLDTNSKPMNANAAVTPDEHKSVRSHRHHHRHVSANKQLKTQPDAGSKQVPATDKRS